VNWSFWIFSTIKIGIDLGGCNPTRFQTRGLKVPERLFIMIFLVKYFVKVYDVRRTDRRLWPVELKTQILKLFPFYVKNGTRYIIKLCIFLKKYFTKKIIIKSLSGTLRPLVWKRVGLQPPKSIENIRFPRQRIITGRMDR
jgi:hypothetical protein